MAVNGVPNGEGSVEFLSSKGEIHEFGQTMSKKENGNGVGS